jgi:hypothetical protein
MAAELFRECFVGWVEIPHRPAGLAYFPEESSRRQPPSVEFNNLNGRLYACVTESVSGTVSQLGRELDHGLAKAKLREKLTRERILARGVKDQARSTFFAQSVTDRFDEPPRNTLTPLSNTDEDVVQRAAGVKQRVPIPRFQSRVSVAHDVALELGGKDQRVRVRQLAGEEARVAALHVGDQHEAKRIEVVVLSNELPGERGDGGEIAWLGRANDRGHVAERSAGRRAV